ncbi:SRPBCC family protein [Cryptosporangium sp. NPDC048952]|uniref:SRPBCC family protein n=1 Tax=Cryptosporangium sp. NPDC048952 TaxID=3363961 RepID=UPI00372120B2
MTYPTHIDENAVVVVRRELTINAPIDRVWKLHVDVDGWPEWQTDIGSAQADGPLDVGSTFRWTTSGLSIVSTVYAIDVPHRILWGGPAHGIDGVHQWTFTANGAITHVRTKESWDGDPVRADAENLRASLDASLASWLTHLATAAEAATARIG